MSAYVFDMATTKITVALPDGQLQSIRKLVAAGKAGSVSAFLKHAVVVGLFDAVGWQAILSDALQQTGGPLTNGERKWADGLLCPPARVGRGTGKNRAS